MTFTVVEGNTVIDDLGSPIADAAYNGGVLEMASLYADNDPDPNHQDPPADSGTLVSFAIDCNGDPNVLITVTENAKRGGIVLEDPDVNPADNLPQVLVYECSVPMCWDCPSQPYGDATGDGRTNILDLLALRKAWNTNSDTSPHGTATGEYNCCADFTQDTPTGRVNILDLLRLRQNWNRVGDSCTHTDCP
jgi:hypothetical protein